MVKRLRELSEIHLIVHPFFRRLTAETRFSGGLAKSHKPVGEPNAWYRSFLQDTQQRAAADPRAVVVQARLSDDPMSFDLQVAASNKRGFRSQLPITLQGVSGDLTANHSWDSDLAIHGSQKLGNRHFNMGGQRELLERALKHLSNRAPKTMDFIEFVVPSDEAKRVAAAMKQASFKPTANTLIHLYGFLAGACPTAYAHALADALKIPRKNIVEQLLVESK